MLWLKALHIVFVVAWFAGVFYLPRLFIYHASATDSPSRERFKVMERRLFGMMMSCAVVALALGLTMIVLAPAFLEMGWMHAKLTLVALLLVHHFICWRLVIAFREDRNRRSERWLRVFNELPLVALIGIVILVVVKPF